MNIYLIHGDNSIASYERLTLYLNKAKANEWEIVDIDNDNIDIKNLLRSNTLFGNKRLVVIRKYTLIESKTIEYLKTTDSQTEILIYHDNLIPDTFIKKLTDVKKNEVFKISKYLWKFIDNFYPDNIKNCLFFFHESLKADPAELIFSILVGQLKDMYLVLNTDKPLPYPLWRSQNIQRQAEKFGQIKIKSVIDGLSKIDIKTKTSSASLKDELDLFIIRKLK
jgi:DNA polymerase III delta subunit